MKSSRPNPRDESSYPEDTTDYQGTAGEPVGVTAGGQPVVDSPGAGSLDTGDHQKDKAPEEVDPDVLARTMICARWGDADGNEVDDPEKYERLWRYHSGWDNDSTGRREHNDKVWVAASLASALDLSENQTHRVTGIASHVSGDHFNKDKGIVGLALGAIAYVGEKDATERAKKDMYEGPEKALEDRIITSDKFNELCAQHGVDGQEACNKVKEIYHGQL
jgi:hypothetical protein